MNALRRLFMSEPKESSKNDLVFERILRGMAETYFAYAWEGYMVRCEGVSSRELESLPRPAFIDINAWKAAIDLAGLIETENDRWLSKIWSEDLPPGSSPRAFGEALASQALGEYETGLEATYGRAVERNIQVPARRFDYTQLDPGAYPTRMC